MIFNKGLSVIGEFIVEKLRNELEQQGHRNKGTLIDTMRFEIKETNNGYELLIIARDYAKYLENAMPSGIWVNVFALAEWVESKGIATGEREIKNVAFAIRRTFYNEGRPTKGSLKFSNTGKRDEFITIVMDANAQIIIDKVAKLFDETVNLGIENAVKNI